MKEIRAIFSDLDGTLLNDQKEISEETISLIKKLREKGYLFGLATGRPIPGIVNHCKQPLSAASKAAFPGQSRPY